MQGRVRTIRRHANGAATVSLVLRDRPWSAVVADMIEGFVVVNDVDAAAAECLRDLLWSTLDEVELRPDGGPGAPVTDLVTATALSPAASPAASPPLSIVDAA